jgi:glycosyltransferase involved in cell wall biosynthesis
MKIAILGSRGIPNDYGGFEECAEHLAIFLKEMNNEVYVYSTKSHPFKGDMWNGVHLIHIEDFARSSMNTSVLYDFLCLLDVSHRQFDVVIQLGYSPSGLFSIILKVLRVPTITNMAGMEWKRSKWGPLARNVIRLSERLAVRNSDIVVSDNIGVKQYIDEKYGVSSVFIPYGATIPSRFPEEVICKYRLKKGQYMLVIARLQADNNVEMIIKGCLQAHIEGIPLVIVGALNSEYAKNLKTRYGSNQNIQFVGANYDKEELMTLRKYSFIYFHGHSAGGTNPSLLEAMAAGARIAAFDCVFNRNVLGPCAVFFKDKDDITRIILNIDRIYEGNWIAANRIKITNDYQWNKVGMQYLNLALNLARRKLK